MDRSALRAFWNPWRRLLAFGLGLGGLLYGMGGYDGIFLGSRPVWIQIAIGIAFIGGLLFAILGRRLEVRRPLPIGRASLIVWTVFVITVLRITLTGQFEAALVIGSFCGLFGGVLIGAAILGIA